MKHALTQGKKEILASLTEMGVATDLMEEFLTSQTDGEIGGMATEVERVHGTMAKAEWTLQTRTTVTGMIEAEPIELELIAHFLVDSKTLRTKVDRMKTTDTSNLGQVIEALKSKENGEELSRVVQQAYLPRSYGVTAMVQAKTLVRLEPVEGEVRGVVELTVDSGLVHFEFAQLVNVWLPDPVGVSSEIFRQNCWVNWEFLLNHEPFSKDFAWEDTSNKEPLSLKVETKWERV